VAVGGVGGGGPRSPRRVVPSRATCSAVVITRNEAPRLGTCLASLAWTDEIVVVDAESSDATVEIARQFTERVIVRPWPGFASQKNFATGHAQGDWILSVDADEEVSTDLRREILAVLAEWPPGGGFAGPRRNIFWGRWIRHGGLYPDWQVRLFQRGRGRFVERAVHESLEVAGEVQRLGGPLVHRSYESVTEFLERAHRYSSLAADDLIRGGARIGPAQLVLRPLARFLNMYLVHRGFLDGTPGFLLAALYAYYVFIRSAKVWEKTRA
jgi:(heptosyl)LPS beta-1,4-glucosyltransferase